MMSENLYLAKNRSPQFFYGYVIVLVSFLIMVVAWGTFYTFGVFFKPLLAEFGWTRAITSGAFSLSIIIQGFLGIIIGRLTDRFGPRVIMAVCGLFLGSGYLLMSQTSLVWHLYLFYGVMIGIGLSASWIPLVSTIARWFVKGRGIMTGVVISGIGIGIIIMPPLVGWLISSYGWRTSYIIIGIIVLVLIVLAAQFLRKEPGQVGQLPYGEGEKLNSATRDFSLREAFHNPRFWILSAIYLCFGFSLESIMVHIDPHVTEFGISAAIAAGILAIIGGGSIPGRLVMGAFADRAGGKVALIVGFVLLTIALFWLQLAKEVWMFYLFAAIFGFAFGTLYVVLSPIVAELFGLSSHGAILGIIIFGYTIGGTIGPILAGKIFDITSSYQLAFLVFAIISAVGLVLTLFLKPMHSEV